MLKVPIEQARPGMILARSVPNPEKPHHTLLKSAYQLDSDLIGRLRALRIPSLWVRYPSLDFLDDVLDPETTRHQQEIYASLKQQFSASQQISLAKVNYAVYLGQVSLLFQRILDTRLNSSTFINELHGQADDVLLHGTTVAYLALLLGMKLDAYIIRERPRVPAHLAMDLTQLGVGCLLHDIGKLQLPPELRSFRLSAQDRGDPLWQQHTEAGFDMVQGGLDPTAAQVVLNHHQHFDGSGFPARSAQPGISDDLIPLKADQIHIFCRIAALADRFDGFRKTPDGKTVPTIIALKRLQKPGYKKWFDPLIFNAFLETVPAFTPGDQVQLNDGQPAVVIETNDRKPCRPVVRPIDPQLAQNPDQPPPSQEACHQDIDLAIRSDIFIEKIEGYNITKYLY